MDKFIRDKFKFSRDRIYFDNSASTQKPYDVVKSISDFYNYNYGPVHRAIYSSGENSTIYYENSRNKVAEFINCDNSELIFTSGTTDSINFVVNAWAYNNLKSGDEIILTELEHNSNLAPWIRLAKQKNLIIKYIPVNDSGELDLDSYLNMLTPKTKLVSFTACSNSLGTTITEQEIDLIVSNAKNFGAKTLVDAAQAVSYKKIDVKKNKSDFLAFSAHKMFGPTGIGALYISKSIQSEVEPYKVGGGMISNIDYNHFEPMPEPLKYEAGTPPIAQAIGFASAIDFINDNILYDDLNKYLSNLCNHFIEETKENPKIKILGPIDNLKKYGHLISFNIANLHPHDVAAYLDQNYNIEVRAGNHCTNALFQKLNIKGSVRASFHVYNTIEEINLLIKALNNLSELDI